MARCIPYIASPHAGASMDTEFDRSVDMMVNDFDDERTLDEEEALEGSEDPQMELSYLQEEGDMPLEELLAMYDNYGDPTSEKQPSSGSEELISSQEATLEKDDIDNESMAEGGEPKKETSDLQDLYTDIPLIPKQKDHSDTCRLLRFSRQPSDVDEEEVDYDYSPDEEWKKTTMVGNDHQATIPDGLCKYDDALPYENKDKLLWDPKPLEESEFEKFLIKAREPLVNKAQGMTYVPTSIPVKDDEQALYLLLQCGYNVEEALRRRRMNVVPPTDTMSLWSEEECRNFEDGLIMFGKDFYLIQKNKVRTRSVGELVQFYYLWKKTERYDIFAIKARLQNNKYTLHPGVSDYMDRFLDEPEIPGSYRCSSPNEYCLLCADPKRQQRVQESMADSHNHIASPSDTLGDLDKQLDCESIESITSLATSAGGNASESGINCGANVSTLGPEGSSTNGGELSIVKADLKLWNTVKHGFMKKFYKKT